MANQKVNQAMMQKISYKFIHRPGQVNFQLKQK